MIKEKAKKTKYNFKKSIKHIVFEYLRTIGFSILIACFITTGLAIHARTEMIKNIYAASEQQKVLDKKVALHLITRANLLEDIQNKTYSVCMHAGEIYETAEDYYHAQIAYENAVQKSKSGKYKAHYRLICVLLAQEKFDLANAFVENIKDYTSISLVKFKTRSFITIGDKYYSIGKALSAAKSYEQAYFYYNKFSKKDKKIVESIVNRIVNAYISVADVMVKTGLNSDAVRFLKKAENYRSNDFNIKYKLAIVLSDSDPEKSVEYIESLLEERPQDVDYNIYGSALMKAANIADLDGRTTQAKYYRYKIHSIDLFINRKIIYKNDIDVSVDNIDIKKNFFVYPIKLDFNFMNTSAVDIINLKGDFVLLQNGKQVETISTTVANKNSPLLSSSFDSNIVPIKFKKTVFTKKELENYSIKVYLYKDEKFKTFISEVKIINKQLNTSIDDIIF